VPLERHQGGADARHAQGMEGHPECVVANLRRRVKRLLGTAIGRHIKTKTAAFKTLRVETLRALAKPVISGAIVLGVLSTSVPAAAQISPGPLARAHQSINGVTGCVSCHEVSAGKPIFKCLGCHTEIASRVATGTGLHATYDIKPGSSEKCATCHSEHNGEDFILTKWDLKTFDHGKTGYKLEGAHSNISCNRCHSTEHIPESERATIKLKDLNKTFLGVSPACTNCHKDRHEGRLGADCLRCHDFVRWKPIDVVRFDHSLTAYPLTGLHSKIACQKCHLSGRDGQPRYTGLAFRNCSDCHADPHRGGFPQTCQSCHTTAVWSTISRAALNRAFDHSKTKYPLLGKHAEVECVKCHTNGDFTKPLAFQKCSDCHHPDPHGGQFNKRAGGAECSGCHTVDGFKPSTFRLKEHAATRYPLQGKHAGLRCAQCHVPSGKTTIYKIKFQYCTDCHGDEHAGQFAKAPHLNHCEECHGLQGFRPSTFTLSRHNKLSFDLSGSHLAIPCIDCHKTSANFKPKPTAQYHWSGVSCTSCHADPHQGRFNALVRAAGPNRKALGCDSCHSTETWDDVSRFDHSKTTFPLLGAHKTTRCRNCHEPLKRSVSLSAAEFKTKSARCEACHADPHGSQFARVGGTTCADCHASTRWKPSSFNHDKQTLFALQGVHRNVPCESCHRLSRMVGRKVMRFYKPTPRQCVGCHGPDTAKHSATTN